MEEHSRHRPSLTTMQGDKVKENGGSSGGKTVTRAIDLWRAPGATGELKFNSSAITPIPEDNHVV